MMAALGEVKEHLKKEAESRDAIIAQGQRAFRMGIEKRNNPRKEQGERNLWDIGYDAASRGFDKLFPRM